MGRWHPPKARQVPAGGFGYFLSVAKDIVKGYPIERDQYVTFTPEEPDAVRLETKKTLDLT